METSHPLATESFSYSWLSNVKPSLDCLNKPLRTYLEASHEANSSRLDSTEIVKSSFDFDIPLSPSALVHADELFSNGLIKPLFVDPSKIEDSETSDFITILPGRSSSFSSRNGIPKIQDHRHFFIKLRKSSKQILQKWFGYLFSFWHKVRMCRKSNRIDDIDMRVLEVKSCLSWSNSPQASPQLRITEYSSRDYCDIESSIYEAILHCKRSVEN